MEAHHTPQGRLPAGIEIPAAAPQGPIDTGQGPAEADLPAIPFQKAGAPEQRRQPVGLAVGQGWGGAMAGAIHLPQGTWREADGLGDGGDQGRQLVLGRRRIQDQRLIQAFGPGTIRRQQGQQGPLALQRRRPLADCQGRQQALQGQQGQIACWGRLRLIAGFAAEELRPVEQQQQATGVDPGTIQAWRGRWLFSRGGGQGIDSGVLG